MTELRFENPEPVEVSCNCKAGPCGWTHYVPGPGPTRYFLDDKEITEERAHELHQLWREEAG